MLLTMLVLEESDNKHKTINSLGHSSQVWESASDTISSDSKWLQLKGNKENALNNIKQKREDFSKKNQQQWKTLGERECVLSNNTQKYSQ